MLVGLSVLVVLLGSALGLRAARARHRARAAAREDTPLRRAARRTATVRPAHDAVLSWVPDDRHGGWRLSGRYLPAVDEDTLITDA